MADEQDVPIQRYLDASTTHIHKADADALAAADVEGIDGVDGAIVYPYTDGSFVMIPEAPQELAQESERLSACFWNLLDFARRHGCTIVRLDPDAPTVPDLPQFNW